MDSATSVMRQLYRAPEPEVLKPLLARARSVPNERQRIVNRAAGLIGDLRTAQGTGWVDRKSVV